MAEKSEPNKSDFIRSLPATMPVAEVVAKAQEQGLEIRPHLVYMVRRNARLKRGRKPAEDSGPSVTTPASIADFVRAHADLTPKEIVAKANAEGMKLHVSYVYAIRQSENRKASSSRPRRARARAAESVPRPIASSSRAEELLKAVAAEIGLGRAIGILEAERAKVRAVIGGG